MADSQESWTHSNDDFFNNSFHNKDRIDPKDLGHGLNPSSRAKLCERHQEILDIAAIEDGFIPLMRPPGQRSRILQLTINILLLLKHLFVSLEGILAIFRRQLIDR
jgi:hypothetical protein